jgi:hypothetical protein
LKGLKKHKRDYKETLRRYNVWKPIREVGPGEQVDLIFNFEEEK